MPIDISDIGARKENKISKFIIKHLAKAKIFSPLAVSSQPTIFFVISTAWRNLIQDA